MHTKTEAVFTDQKEVSDCRVHMLPKLKREIKGKFLQNVTYIRYLLCLVFITVSCTIQHI